ncbi:chitinase [Amycolatopsis antarctica]|uniref:chitinase n=1 Tax=Amycolatopsis antarctica TaxID=1854586 RepID=UPI000D7C2627|nr:chitinase [Amycolatopsis antarctica]
MFRKTAAVLAGAAMLAAASPAASADVAPEAASPAYAPYLYNGWGDPPDPVTVMEATGTSTFTLAFVLSNGDCDPQWDGSRPLTGGVDQGTIDAIRGAGGDVVPSFGGWSGNKLEITCTSPEALAGAYQKVIDAYGLSAIDIDIEGDAYEDDAVRQRTVDALKQVKEANPELKVYVTFGTGQDGPDTRMIDAAASSGLTVDAWTIMPFNFGGNGQNMGELTVRATDGLKNAVKNAYGYSDEDAYRHSGISSMNGNTDVGEVVNQGDFQSIVDYANANHLGRLAYWSVNRDRPCAGGGADSCSGIPQQEWEFTGLLAQFQG